VIAPQIPVDESRRLAALLDLAVLDTEAEERFDRLTRLAARILDVPIALVSLIDADRQWFKSRVGLADTETSRDVSFCGHAVLHDELFVVTDATQDERFVDNPLVVSDPSIRFYAGRPLHAALGERVGTLCVIDRQPRDLTPEDRQVIEDLAELVERELNQRTLADAWEATRATHARYQAIFENLHESISLIRPGEGWVLGNDASDRMLGYPEGTTRLDNRQSFVHPDDIDAASQAFRDVVSGARRGDDPWLVRVKAADGTWHWFESVANDLRTNPDVRAVLVSTRDVTERVARAQQHELIVEHSPLGIWTLDPDATVAYVNDRLAALLGYDPADMVGEPAERFYMPEQRAGFRERWGAVSPGRLFHTREMPYQHRDGHAVLLEMTACGLFTPNGQHQGATAMFRDRTHELALEAKAAVSERRYELLFEHSSDVITVMGADHTWKYSSPAGTRLLGYAPDQRPDGGIFALVHPDDVPVAMRALEEVHQGARGPHEPVTFRVLTIDGNVRHFESTGVNLIGEPLIDGVMIVSRDVTERVELTQQLEHAAGHDALTDLVNRGAFSERLEAALARQRRDGLPVAVCFLDLDRFKEVNDTLGHQVGDEVLCGVADRLRRVVRVEDVAARLGGDEFVVLLAPVDDVDDVRGVASRLVDELAVAHTTSAGPVTCAASVGVAFARAAEGSIELLARADAALYEAKRAGRGRVVYAADPT
jgi:diguanylate cyclase (GGDEF)-like protein/PAS domain S-box-containing protein